jgi:hypothetical protein
MKSAGGSEDGERDNKATPRSAFQDQALLLFYFVIIAVSMGGWLWFLGYLSWNIVNWVTLR